MRHSPARIALLVSVLLLAGSAAAERIVETNGRRVQLFPHRDAHQSTTGGKSSPNLTYHNGPVIHQARVVPIFWGPASVWGTAAAPSALAQSVVAFFAQFGNTGEYNVITQYYDFGGSVQATSLTASWVVDNSTPPVNVTDAAVQAEVVKVLGVVPVDAATVYEVFLPPGSYASYGTATSCGGPHLQFCAYHSNFAARGVDVKYASMPYPSCGGCQWPGWTDAQNLQHFASHETREAVTDPDGTAWFDRQGAEADDKCAWSPSPFLDNGYGYQYEWSNLSGGCVRTR